MNFSFLKKSLDDFASILVKKAEQLEQKRIELVELTKLPLPREDIATGICLMLDKQAKCYPEKLAITLRGVIDNPEFDFANSQMDLISSSGGSCQPGILPKQNAAWFFGKQIQKRIVDAIEMMPYPEKVGLPLAKRKPIIDKLVKEIAQLEQEAMVLRDEAENLGIRIEAPLTERERKVALTKEVTRLTEVTPFPDHTVRRMLLDGIDPLEEMKKIPAQDQEKVAV